MGNIKTEMKKGDRLVRTELRKWQLCGKGLTGEI